MIARLSRAGAGRPHVFMVTAPGGTRARLAVEAELRRLGWPEAASPAEADLLVECGEPHATLAPLVERAWQAIGAPAARARVTGASASEPLEAARLELADPGVQRRLAAAAQPQRHEPLPTETGGQGEHGGHQMHGGGTPAGLPLAERAEDRDGLQLDRLHVPLGPLLPLWPAGLIVRTILQGDVVQDAEAAPLAPSVAGRAFWDEPWLRAATGDTVTRGDASRQRAAAHLDSLGRLLGVAGWDDAAAQARRARDEALAGAAPEIVRADAASLARRLRRSRTLRWSTAGLGMLPSESAAAAGVTGPALRAGGDVADRWRQWVDETLEAAAALDDAEPLGPEEREGPRGRLDREQSPSAALLDVLPYLLVGLDIGSARLVVASLDPDLDSLPATAAPAAAHAHHHG